jgi:hypothetical protein
VELFSVPEVYAPLILVAKERVMLPQQQHQIQWIAPNPTNQIRHFVNELRRLQCMPSH